MLSFGSLSNLRSPIMFSSGLRRSYGLCLMIITILSFFFFDRTLLFLLQSFCKIDRPILNFLSFLIFPPLYLIISTGAFFFFRFALKSSRFSPPLFEIVVSQSLSVGIVRILKVLIGRGRPNLYLASHFYGIKPFSFDHYFHSFPSGHIVAAFTLASSLTLLYPRFHLLFFMLALLLASSRLFLLEHFFSDFTGSIFLGILIARCTHIVLKKKRTGL
jgi:membrane-associated phospholipid phosphatase